MNPHKIISWFSALLLTSLLLLTQNSCQQREAEIPDPANAMYYWRSELKLSAGERAFVEQHEVRKIYLHLFDVVRQEKRLRPNATLLISDTLPQRLRVVPVVFLNHNIMADTTGLAELPGLLARRVAAMMEQNRLGPLDELQIDFDWTKRNQSLYFDLLRRLRKALQQQGTPVKLSSTIRLHQLGMEAPPVDYGALMVYNLGRIQSPDEANSILTVESLKPYLRYLKGYNLPLTTALPLYSWDLLFHENEFRCILRNTDLADTSRFVPIDPTHYRAISYQPIPTNGVTLWADGRIYPGDVVRHEQIPAEVLRQVCQLIADRRPSACGQIILYHLDEKQLNQYLDEDIQTLFAGH